jgi:hypothetical protein
MAKSFKLFNVFSREEYYYKYPHDDEIFNVVATYICTDYEGTLKIDDIEVRDVRFFHLNELPANISLPDLPIIKEFINQLE